MKTYTPRRANLTRWLQDAPAYVLDCFDHPKEADRFTVFLTGKDFAPDDRCGEIQFISLDAEGRSSWSALKVHDAATFRYRNSRHRVAWNSLPESVRKAFIARANYPVPVLT